MRKFLWKGLFVSAAANNIQLRRSQILEAVRVTESSVISVTEEEIEYSLLNMMRSGYYIEPTAAAVIAGVVRYQTENQKRSGEETIVSVSTGHWLKSTDKLVNMP